MRTTILIANGPGLGDLSDYDGNTYGGLTLQAIRQTDDQEEMFHMTGKLSSGCMRLETSRRLLL